MSLVQAAFEKKHSLPIVLWRAFFRVMAGDVKIREDTRQDENRKRKRVLRKHFSRSGSSGENSFNRRFSLFCEKRQSKSEYLCRISRAWPCWVARPKVLLNNVHHDGEVLAGVAAELSSKAGRTQFIEDVPI